MGHGRTSCCGKTQPGAAEPEERAGRESLSALLAGAAEDPAPRAAVNPPPAFLGRELWPIDAWCLYSPHYHSSLYPRRREMLSRRVPTCSPSSCLLCRLCHLRVSARSAALLLAENKATVCSERAWQERSCHFGSARGCAGWHPSLGAAPPEPVSAPASAPPQESANGMVMHPLPSRGQSTFH